MSARRFFSSTKKLSQSKLNNANEIIEEDTAYSTHHTRSRSQSATPKATRDDSDDMAIAASASSRSSKAEVDDSTEVFIHNPKDRQRAKKFEQKFGVKYAEGTKTDYPLAIAPIYKLAVHNIPHPYGVMSTTPIPSGGTLAEYTGELMSEEPDDMSYIYRVGKQFIDGRVIGSIGRFFNHSDNNNCQFVVENGKVLVKTLRDITPGEQLTINYGHKYFTTDIDRVYIDAHHTDLSFQNMLLQRQENYTTLSALKNSGLKKTIKQLMNCTDESRILVPTTAQPNYPILVLNNGKIDDNPAEITLFQALCMQQDNYELLSQTLSDDADINIQDSNGRNALYYVISNPNIPETQKAATLKHLFSESNNYDNAPFITDRNFKTVFHYCIENHLNQCLDILLKAVIFKIEYFDFVVESPINTAIRSQNIDGLTLLLTKYSYINLQNHLASENDQLYLVKCIAGISSENVRNKIYAIFSEFMNIGILAAHVQEYQKQLAKKTQRSQSTRSYSSSSSSHSSASTVAPRLLASEDNHADPKPDKRKSKPNPRYASSDFISNGHSKKPAEKRPLEESPKHTEADNSHTVFSRKKQKHIHIDSTQAVSSRNSAMQISPIRKNTRMTRSRH